MKKLSFAIISLGLMTVGSITQPSARASNYSAAVLADNPLGYYRMSETSGTTAFDSAGTAQNGVYQNGVTLGAAGPQAPAFIGFEAANTGGYFFNNANQQLEITTLTTLNTTAYSFEEWFNFTSDGVQYLGGRGSGASGSYDAVGLNGTDLLFYNGTGGAVFGPLLSQGTWHYLVYTRDNTDVKVYIDSVLDISTTLANTYGVSDRIVAGLRPGDLGFTQNVTLDELAIYDTALTADQVSAHYFAAFTVPEPSTLLLLGLGGLLLRKRFGKHR